MDIPKGILLSRQVLNNIVEANDIINQVEEFLKKKS
jgi:hypothetical protein